MLCQCLCRPMGHDHNICTEDALTGLTVPLGRDATVRVPACPACHRAVGRSETREPLRHPRVKPVV